VCIFKFYSCYSGSPESGHFYVNGGIEEENILPPCGGGRQYLNVACEGTNHFCSAIKKTIDESTGTNITLLLRNLDNYAEDGIEIYGLEEVVIGFLGGYFF
jgi:hypothetical protein